MSELISNPQSEPEPPWTDGSGHVAQDGPDGLPHPGIVIRYDAATDPSDREDDPGVDDGEEPEPDSEPASGGGAVDRARALLGAAARGLLALSWACLLAAYRYPRWALVIVLSVVILGAITLTRPGKPAPPARIPGENAAASASGPDHGQDPQKAKEQPKGGQPALADAGSPSGAKAEDGAKEAKKDGEASASPPAPDPASPPGPGAPKVAEAAPTGSARSDVAPQAPAESPKVAEAAPTVSTAADKGPSANNPPAANRGPVPAPPPLSDRTDATLLAGPRAGQAPAPLPPSSAEAPEGGDAGPESGTPASLGHRLQPAADFRVGAFGDRDGRPAGGIHRSGARRRWETARRGRVRECATNKPDAGSLRGGDRRIGPAAGRSCRVGIAAAATHASARITRPGLIARGPARITRPGLIARGPARITRPGLIARGPARIRLAVAPTAGHGPFPAARAAGSGAEGRSSRTGPGHRDREGSG